MVNMHLGKDTWGPCFKSIRDLISGPLEFEENILVERLLLLNIVNKIWLHILVSSSIRNSHEIEGRASGLDKQYLNVIE